MIVICTKCKAKFRVADERIGPRGAKVRCSRCQTVFHVAGMQPAPAAGPPSPPRPEALDVELENPFEAGGAPPPAPPEADPFAAAGFGAPAVPPPLPRRPDPLAAVAAAEPAPAPDDPFAPVTPRPDDPFAPRRDPDPFAAPPPAAEPDDGGLALEERLTPPPLPTARGPEPGDNLPPPLASEGFTLGADPSAFEAYDFGADGPSLALSTEPGPGPAGAPAALPAPAAAGSPAPAPAADPEPAPVAAAEPGFAAAPPPAAAPRAAPVPEAASPAPDSGDIVPVPAPAARESRLRAAAVNAVALLALLVVTLAFLVVWRSDGGERLSFRPAAVLAALGRGGPDRPFAAIEVRSGVYEREKGPPVLFVRGKVVSHAAAPVRAVKVNVEVVRSEAVLARGEALAGAVPTPEELYQAVDEAGVAALARAAAARAPREIRPGDAVPFLVPIADAPADLDGASVHVDLASGASAPP